MQILNKTTTITAHCEAWRSSQHRIVLVPTMGFFHDGHISLMRRARELAGEQGKVIVSLFVNPTQFAPCEDLSTYPRNHERDAQLAKKAGVDVLFIPEVSDMYAENDATQVSVPSLATHLCGVTRPTHFQGVCTVIVKLLMLARAHVAIFGQKDWQQLAIIQRMVQDLHIPVEICSCPTVREADGLALSSRNVYLTTEERAQAPEIYKALTLARTMVQQGETRAYEVQQMVLQHFAQALPLGRLDYLSIVNATELVPQEYIGTHTLMACAVQMSKARLIDNILLS